MEDKENCWAIAVSILTSPMYTYEVCDRNVARMRIFSTDESTLNISALLALWLPDAVTLKNSFSTNFTLLG